MTTSFVFLPLVFALLPSWVVGSSNYPVGISNCHYRQWFDKAPERIFVASSGATEIALAMGLADRIQGSSWVAEVWDPLNDDFQKFKHYEKFPTTEELFAHNPDFIYATYSSFFDPHYTSAEEHIGINYTQVLGVEECGLLVPSNVYGENKTYCREELHDYGIATFLAESYCELVEHRPEDVTIEAVYQEIWDIGAIFDIRGKSREIINGIEDDFAKAKAISQSASDVATADVQPLSVLWLDMYNLTESPDPDDPESYVGACCGGPQLILEHSGARNVFEKQGLDDRRIWDRVSTEAIVASDPDLIVLVELTTNSAAFKMHWLCSDPRTRNMRAVQNRAFIYVPFAASNLGVRTGSVVYNFAEAMAALMHGTPLNALEFTTSEDGTAASISGAKVWTTLPMHEGIDLETFCPGGPKSFDIEEINETNLAVNSDDSDLPSWAIAVLVVACVVAVAVIGFLTVVVRHEKKGEPLFAPMIKPSAESA